VADDLEEDGSRLRTGGSDYALRTLVRREQRGAPLRGGANSFGGQEIQGGPDGNIEVVAMAGGGPVPCARSYSVVFAGH
jgi:hypothetical protein